MEMHIMEILAKIDSTDEEFCKRKMVILLKDYLQRELFQDK